MRIKLLTLFALLIGTTGLACTCPLTTLSLEETAKYELIFKGTVTSVRDCGDRFGEAVFKVDEVYKGNVTEAFSVLFECDDPCAKKFQSGEEWIIYSNHRQLNNAKMDWCSRSRKFFSNDKEDYYMATYGNDYYDEVKFLREKLGLHRLLVPQNNAADQRNILPDIRQSIIILVSSLLVIIVFYILFRRVFR